MGGTPGGAEGIVMQDACELIENSVHIVAAVATLATLRSCEACSSMVSRGFFERGTRYYKLDDDLLKNINQNLI